MATMTKVFKNVETMRARGNIVIMAYDGPKIYGTDWMRRAAALQKRYGFAYNLTELADDFEAMRWDTKTEPLTDDFAPSEILNMEKRPPR
jgi:hypothetical protein